MSEATLEIKRAISHKLAETGLRIIPNKADNLKRNQSEKDTKKALQKPSHVRVTMHMPNAEPPEKEHQRLNMQEMWTLLK